MNSQIAQLEASLNQENISDDEKATIRSQIAELEKEKADLQAQIVQLGEQILADEAQLKELHETLDSLYAQMETLITNCEDLSENERSVYLTSTQNERKIAIYQ